MSISPWCASLGSILHASPTPRDILDFLPVLVCHGASDIPMLDVGVHHQTIQSVGLLCVPVGSVLAVDFHQRGHLLLVQSGLPSHLGLSI